MKELNNFSWLKLLDEETLRAMMRTAVREGSPGDDKIRLVFQVASDETLDMAGKSRLFGGVGASSSTSKPIFRMVERVMEGRPTSAFLERPTQHPMEKSRKNRQKCLSGGKGI